MKKIIFVTFSLSLMLILTGICLAGSVTHTGYGTNADIYIESMHGNVTDVLTTQADYANVTQTFQESGSGYYGPNTNLNREVYIENGRANGISFIDNAGYDGDEGELNVNIESLSNAEGDYAYFEQNNGYNNSGNSGSSLMEGVGDYGLSQYARRFSSEGSFEGGTTVDLNGTGSGQIITNKWQIGGIPSVSSSGFGDRYDQEVPDTHYGDDNMYVMASGSGVFEAETNEWTPIWSNPSLSHALSSNFDSSMDYVDIEKSTGHETSTYNFNTGINLEASLMFK